MSAPARPQGGGASERSVVPEEQTMRFLSFNTGRLYTIHGQRIVAATDGVRIVFRDIDRMIGGVLPASAGFTPQEIMRSYDRGAYDIGARTVEEAEAVQPLEVALQTVEATPVSEALRI